MTDRSHGQGRSISAAPGARGELAGDTEAELRALLAAAGSRLARGFPTASAMSVIEAVPS
ncbi:hypothetical protein [Sorangium sp. So ce1151]|uniref:hypothetical protein n=1 Tax=Sorangium sp. So ce1151 TaxID=3133332 RepID=UPI003F5E36CA